MVEQAGVSGAQHGHGRRDRGQLEAMVLEVLTERGAPMTAGEVQASLDGDPAYTTVLTTLTRLHRKGALARERRGRAFAYTAPDAPRAAADAMAARRMRNLLDSGADRAGVLARFLSELDAEDEQILHRILHASEPDETP